VLTLYIGWVRTIHLYIYTVYIQYVLQENHHIYGHIRCVYTVLANPINTPLPNLCVTPSLCRPHGAQQGLLQDRPPSGSCTGSGLRSPAYSPYPAATAGTGVCVCVRAISCKAAPALPPPAQQQPQVRVSMCVFVCQYVCVSVCVNMCVCQSMLC
jgi:hypothetical protein